MKVSIGIPAFKAQDHICDCLSSIQMQSIKKDIEVIIATDNPDDDYNYTKERYPDLDIKVLPCEKNTGAGLARQRCIDACTTDWITFIDADDVFFTPLAIEQLVKGIKPNVVMVQGTFLQEITDNPDIRVVPMNNPWHPWVFARLYNVRFLKQNDISFTELRAMEDGELNWKLRMTIEGSQWVINVINELIYLWRIGSEHSITRSGAEEDGIPQYNFDLCQIGATIASIRATKFCREKNPFNGGIDRFATEMMVGHYFTYVECKERKPIFAEQNLFNAKRFYHECFSELEKRVSDKILSDIYTVQRGQHANELLGIIPDITFKEFMEKVRTDPYGGEDELREIRCKLPEKVIEADQKTGVATF